MKNRVILEGVSEKIMMRYGKKKWLTLDILGGLANAIPELSRGDIRRVIKEGGVDLHLNVDKLIKQNEPKKG